MQDGSTPLHYAAAFGQTHVLETLVKAGIAVDNRDDARNTPLHLAAGQLSHDKGTLQSAFLAVCSCSCLLHTACCWCQQHGICRPTGPS